LHYGHWHRHIHRHIGHGTEVTDAALEAQFFIEPEQNTITILLGELGLVPISRP
jgi:hypothetical protein